jgi:hypothetical protein
MIELQRRTRQQVHLQARLVESTCETDLLDWSEHVRVKVRVALSVTERGTSQEEERLAPGGSYV